MLRALADNTSTGVNVNCENKELAMKWLDVLLADPKATEVRIRGFEGQDWEYNEDGEAVPIFAEDGSTADIAKYGCGQIALPHYQNEDSFMFYSTVIPWYVEQYKYVRDSKWVSPSVPQVAVYTDEEQEKLDLVSTDVTSYFKEMRDKFIIGQASLDSDWDSYVSTMKSLGLDTYVEVFQSVYDRTR